MKWLLAMLAVLNLSACAGLDLADEPLRRNTAPAQVGVVNHTGNYIYSSSIDGTGGGEHGAMGGRNREHLLCLHPRGLVSRHESSGKLGYARRAYAYR